MFIYIKGGDTTKLMGLSLKLFSFVCVCFKIFIEEGTSKRSRKILYNFCRAAAGGNIYHHNLSWYLSMIIDGVNAQGRFPITFKIFN